MKLYCPKIELDVELREEDGLPVYRYEEKGWNRFSLYLYSSEGPEQEPQKCFLFWSKSQLAVFEMHFMQQKALYLLADISPSKKTPVWTCVRTETPDLKASLLLGGESLAQLARVLLGPRPLLRRV